MSNLNQIKYKSGYKYQVVETYIYRGVVKPFQFVDIDFLSLRTDGTLVIKKGYAWDGPSGPTIDTKSFMRGSLIHDAYYQLMRQGKIPLTIRRYVDDALVSVCKEDGMNFVRRWYVYKAVRMFGGAKSRCKEPVPIETAP